MDDRTRELAVDYLEGRLAPEGLAELERRLEADEADRREFLALAQDARALEAMFGPPGRDLPEAVRGEILAGRDESRFVRAVSDRLRRPQERTPRPFRRPAPPRPGFAAWPFVLVAAGFVVAVVLAATSRPSPRPIPARVPPPSARREPPAPAPKPEPPPAPAPERPAPTPPPPPPPPALTPAPAPAPKKVEAPSVPAPAPPAPVPAPRTTEAAPAGAARVARLDGRAIQVLGGRESALQEGGFVAAGAELRADAMLELAFPDTTRVTLEGPAIVSGIAVDAGLRMHLAVGSLHAVVAPQAAGRAVVFDTPEAEATVLGTTLRLSTGDGLTRLEVEKGKVRLARDADRGSIHVEAGWYALVTAEAKIPLKAFPVPQPLGEADHARITAVAVSPDGRRVASTSDDGSLKLWDPRTRAELGLLRPHPRVATSVDFAPSSPLVATGSYDDTVAVWDLTADRLLVRIAAHPDSVEAVRFSPIGRILASAASDGVVRLWDLPSGKLLDAQARHAGRVKALAFSPDGRLLASGGEDGRAKLLDMAGRERASIAAPGGAVLALDFSPDGRSLATASADGTVRLWDVRTGAEFRPFSGTDGGATMAVTFSPDGRLLVSAGANGRLLVWDAALGRIGARLEAGAAALRGAAFSPDGRLLVVGGQDGRLRFWRMR